MISHSKPKRIQRKRTKGWRMPKNTVYVGRPSKWGNQYTVGIDGTAEECVNKYQASLFPYTKTEGDLQDYLVSTAHATQIIKELRGKNLACWCPIGSPCHADVLLELANL